MENVKFYNETLGKHINFDELVEEVIDYVNQKSESGYKITVGTDSQGSNDTHFVTAIAVLRIGNGGRYFWTKSENVYCPTLRDRIYKETVRSITFTQELKSKLKEKFGEDFFYNDKISVHIDVGRQGATRDFVETVVGMVKGYGLEAVIKPDSYSAFVLADRHV
ncbi:ribonuclease H-like YkuK family protein [Patescibacteria group bacterium]|nr:ribonuclease H-like YkuK family protein [Patescibacteria group bacterium]